MKRLVILGVEIPDSDLSEAKFYEFVEGNIGETKFMKTVLPTSHLKEDKTYKSLVKQKKEISSALQQYIMDNRK